MLNKKDRSERGAFTKTVRTILEQAQTMTGATCSYVAFSLRDGDRCHVITSSSRDDEIMSTTVELPLESCRLQTRAHSMASLESGEGQSDRLWLTLLPSHENGTIRNALFVPFIVDGRVVGIMGLGNKLKDFTPRDVDMASSFGEYAAIALCDARNADRVQATVDGLRQTVAVRRRRQRIITMCAMCRKVRSDDGSWHLLASVTGDENDTTVSNGLCEECALIFFSQPSESNAPEAHPPSPSPTPLRVTSTRSR